MHDLKYWKKQLVEKRKNTSFNEFLRDIGSRTTMNFSKNNGTISRFPVSDRVKVIHHKDFAEQRHDYVNQGLDYDFNQTFFENFKKLFRQTSLSNLLQVGDNENCEYVDAAVHAKNSYLSVLVTLGSEDVYYSFMVREDSNNVFNSTYIITNNQNIYFSHAISNSYNIFYSRYLKNCSDIWFSSNLTGCKECIFCNDLQNASYYINNKKFEKDDYLLKKEELLLQKENFQDWYGDIRKKGKNYSSKNVSGDFIVESENVHNSIGVINMNDGNNIMYSGSKDTGENCYDMIFGGRGTNDCVGVSNIGGNPDNIYMCYQVGYSSNIFYSNLIEGSNYCLGCVGLINQEYCILNKKYEKDERFKMVDKIFTKMSEEEYPFPDSTGKKINAFGQFFPGDINALNFNDSFAALVGDYDRDEILKRGYMWRDESIKVDIPESTHVIGVDEIVNYEGFDAEGKWRINPELLDKVIVDKNGNYYKIIKQEYDFLVKYGLPIPRIHWIDRIGINFKI